MCSSLSVRPVDQQWRQLAVRFYSKWYRVTSGVSELARRIRLGEQNLTLHTIIFVGLKTNTGELLFEYFQQHRLQHNWCFVTWKKNIGQWVVVHNRVVKTWDSKGARGNPIIHPPTYLHTQSKIISFMKVCNGHTLKIFITSRPGVNFCHMNFSLDNFHKLTFILLIWHSNLAYGTPYFNKTSNEQWPYSTNNRGVSH